MTGIVLILTLGIRIILASYDATVQAKVSSIQSCVWDYCGAGLSCAGSAHSIACADMYSCGYTGNGQNGNPCLTNNLNSQYADEKGFRISQLIGINH